MPQHLPSENPHKASRSASFSAARFLENQVGKDLDHRKPNSFAPGTVEIPLQLGIDQIKRLPGLYCHLLTLA